MTRMLLIFIQYVNFENTSSIPLILEDEMKQIGDIFEKNSEYAIVQTK